MPHHVSVSLPDGRVACADYRETGVVRQMRVINEWVQSGRPPDRVPEAAFTTVAAWLDGHAEQSALCHDSLTRTALGCGHD